MTTIDGLYITDLCENKIALSDDIQNEMHRLRTEGQLSLSVIPIYEKSQISLKVCFLNARSLNKHLSDVLQDLDYTSTDVNIFQKQDILHLKVIICICLTMKHTHYLEMMLLQDFQKTLDHLEVQQYTAVLTIIPDNHNAQTEMA